MLNAVCIPEGVTDARVRSTLLNDFKIELGAGLGELAGKVWRVGLMGSSCTSRNIFLFLSSLYTILKKEGADVRNGYLEAAEAMLGDKES